MHKGKMELHLRGRLTPLLTSEIKVIEMPLIAAIIQQIVTLSKYGHDALDICHP